MPHELYVPPPEFDTLGFSELVRVARDYHYLLSLTAVLAPAQLIRNQNGLILEIRFPNENGY